jgi:DNA repair protein RecO
MPKQVQTEAFVLKKKSLPTRDTIITLLTKDFGKLSSFAKGVKTVTSKRQPHLQTGNLIEVRLHKSNEKHYLQETTLISAFSEIKKNPHKLSSMYLLFFVIDRLFPEGQKEEHSYELIKGFIIQIARRSYTSSLTDLELVLSNLLSSLGYIQNEKKPRDIEQLKVIIEGLINEKLPFFII